MNINFLESKLLKLTFESGKNLEDSVEVSHVGAFSENDRRKFLIQFQLHITSAQGVVIDAVYAGFFSTDQDTTDDFKNGDFIKVNAPAITYPYLRAFIGNLTQSAGINAVTLPVINFQALAKQQTLNEENGETLADEKEIKS